MCNCFEKIEADLKEKVGDPNASLNYMYLMPSFEKKPVIEATYRKKKKDGAFEKKETIISVAYAYCPFCGQELSKDEPLAITTKTVVRVGSGKNIALLGYNKSDNTPFPSSAQMQIYETGDTPFEDCSEAFVDFFNEKQVNELIEALRKIKRTFPS